MAAASVRYLARASADDRPPRTQSTVLKQMKLIHHGGYNDAERESYKEIIYSNTIQSMRCVAFHPFSRSTSRSNFTCRVF